MNRYPTSLKFLLALSMATFSVCILQAQVWDEAANGGGDAGDFPAGGYQGADGAGTFTTITGNNADGIDSYLIEITDAANFFIADDSTLDTRGYLWNLDGSAFCTNDDDPNGAEPDFSFGFGDGSTHPGVIIGVVGTVSNGQMFVLSIGANTDEVFGPGDADVFEPYPTFPPPTFTELQGPTGNPFERYRVGGKGPYTIQLSGCRLGPGPSVPGGEATGLVWDEQVNGGGDAGKFPEGDFQMGDGSDCYSVITGSNEGVFDGIDAYAIEITDAENFYIDDTGGNDTKAYFWNVDGSPFMACDDNAGPNRFGFSLGFGDRNTHLGDILPNPDSIGTVENGETYILSVGSFGDEALSTTGVPVFFDVGTNYEAAAGPFAGKSFQTYNATGNATTYILRLQGCVLAGSVCAKGCDFDLGDVNRDGAVDLEDVDPFVAAISQGSTQCEADIDGDGLVTLEDVDPFVVLLSTGG